MRKITLLFTMVLLVTMSWQSNAQLTEDFEGDPTITWTFMQTEGDDPGFVQSTARFHGGAASFYHNDDNLAAESTSYMISPSHTVVTNEELKFWYNQNYSGSFYVYSGVWISTVTDDPIANPGDFVELVEFGSNGSEGAWSELTFDLTAYVGQTVYIAFKYTGDWADEIYIDDFSIDVAPACPDVANLSAANFAGTNADLSWDVAAGTTGYNWEIQPQGTPQGDGALVESGNVTTNAATATALVDGTDYTLYVQSDCGGGTLGNWISYDFSFNLPPANDECANATVITVNTDATCTVLTSGTIEFATDSGVSDNGAGTPNDDVWFSFEATATVHKISMENVTGSYTDLVHEVLSGDCTTLVSVNVSDNNNSEATGLTIGDTYYVRVFGYSGTAGRNTSFDVCVTTLPPPPANDNCTTATVIACGDNLIGETTNGATDNGDDVACTQGKGVWYKFIGNDNDVTFNVTTAGYDIQVGVATSADCTTFTNVLCRDSVGSTGTETDTFAADAGTDYYIYIAHYNDTSTATGDFDITISCTPYPTCPDVANLSAANFTGTNADLSWDVAAGTTGYNWEIQPQGTPQGDGALVESGNVTTNAATATALVDGTDYTLYVQSDCGGGTLGNWISYDFTYHIPIAGETCAAPIIVGALPYTTSDDTANYGNDYGNGDSTCSNYYLNGDDVVYSFTPAADGSFNIVMSNIGAAYSGIHVMDACLTGTETCVGFVGNSGTADRELNDLALTAGTEYFIVISTWAVPQSTTYDLTITENSCTNATATFTAVEDCTNAQYTVDIDITDMGTATALTISDDQGSATQPSIATGVISFGPYPSGTAVLFTIVDDNDATCTQDNTTSFSCPPANNDFANAEMLTVNAACTNTLGTTIGATASGETPFADCGFTDGTEADVWYSFVAPTDGNATITTSQDITGIDTVMALYSYDGTSLTQVECNDDGGTGITPYSQIDITDNSLVGGNTYYVQIHTYNGNNPGVFNICVVGTPTASVNDLQAVGFTYYPNPVTNELHVTAKENIISLTIYNMLGQEVNTVLPSSLETTIDMSNLSVGNYFIKAQVGDAIGTFKIVKQ